MPGRDGTGPLGKGSMTGGGFGYCHIENINTAYPYFGRGYRKYYSGRCAGKGLGRGFRNRYLSYDAQSYRVNSDINEKQFLGAELKHMQFEIDNIKERLEILNKEESRT